MKFFLKKALNPHIIISFVTILFVFYSAFAMLVNIMIGLESGTKTALSTPGIQFEPFKEHLKNVPRIGYLTNKDISEEKNDGFFLQAQYALAPTIIQLNKPTNNLNMFDYTNAVYSVFALKNYKSSPVYTSPYGPVLAQRN